MLNRVIYTSDRFFPPCCIKKPENFSRGMLILTTYVAGKGCNLNPTYQVELDEIDITCFKISILNFSNSGQTTELVLVFFFFF